MATITGLTADRMQQIIDATIVDADVISDHLILTKNDGSTIDAGDVRGPSGNIPKGAVFPVGATDGDMFVRTDQAGDPIYKLTGGVWVLVGIDPPEASHIVGGAGEPAFEHGFSNYGGAYSTVEFYKDRNRTYLRGTFQNANAALYGAANRIFLLPASPIDYRPSKVITICASLNNAFGQIRIDPDGSVYVSVGNSSFGTLDGMSFRV